MKRLLLITLVAAFILRVVGINYGLPMFFIDDEVSIPAGALKMLELKTLVPALYPEQFRLLYYPPLISYIFLIFTVPVLLAKLVFGGGALDQLRYSVVFDPTAVWLAARIITALLGTLTVYLTFLIGKKLWGQSAGIFASIFMAGSFLAVQLSHFARHWMPATFFLYLTVGLAMLVYLNPRRKTYLWAGLMTGIAFGASYITAVAVFVVLFAHFFSAENRQRARLFDKRLLYFFLPLIIIGGIFALLNLPELQRILFGEDSTLTSPKSLIGLLVALQSSFFALVYYEPVLAAAGLLGFVFLLFSTRRLFWLFFLFPLFYWALLYFFFHFEPRYNLLLVPWWALLSGFAANQLWHLPFHTTAHKILVVLVLLLPFSASGYYDYLLVKKDSRELAKTWVETTIPAQSKVALYIKTLEFTPDIQSVKRLIAEFPYAVRTKERVLKNLEEDYYPTPAYELLNLRDLTPEDLFEIIATWEQEEFAYLVVEYFPAETLPAEIRKLADTRKLIASFRSEPARTYLPDPNGNFYESVFNIFALKNLGPTVEIYKL